MTQQSSGQLVSEPDSPDQELDLLILSVSCGENLRLAQQFAAAAMQVGRGVRVLDLTLDPPPLFNPRIRDSVHPSQVQDLQSALASASHWLICTPEYNGSIPPVLTSAIAWLSVQGDDFRALFNHRPVAISSHSGSGGIECLAALRIQLAHLGAHVVGRQVVCHGGQPARHESVEAILQALFRLPAMDRAQPSG